MTTEVEKQIAEEQARVAMWTQAERDAAFSERIESEARVPTKLLHQSPEA